MFSPDANTGHFVIRQYVPGKLLINADTYSHSVVLLKESLESWSVKTPNEITLEAIEPLIAQQPEMILLGTGTHVLTPSREIIEKAGLAGIGLEWMTTEQACRTYNLLASDGRAVLAALIV